MADDDQLCFHNPNFLASQPLTPHNILDYFATSPFYDKNCNNEILRMQCQFSEIDVAGKLQTTIGFFYTVEDNGNDMYIIAKKAFDGKSTMLLQIYYSIHGYIYKAQINIAIMEARMIDALWHLNEALDKYEAQKQFHWLKGFRFSESKDVKDDEGQDMKLALEIMHEFEKQIPK